MASASILFCVFLSIGVTSISGTTLAVPIVNGNDADIGQFPYQVALQYDDGIHNCGGSILNERYIVTAAHCVLPVDGMEPYPPRFFRVRVGSIQRSMGGKVVKVKRVINNKAYENFLNDIALLELEKPLTWSENIRPIELATEEVASGEDVIISGWGRNSRDSDFSNRLKWSSSKAMTYEECREQTILAHESIICLTHKLQHGTCFGDSGGPAAYDGKLVGITAFVVGVGIPECGSQYPDGYTKIAFHRDWILGHIKNSFE